MGGAFVAVADDATAVYWNPAGIATGSFVSAVIDVGARTSVLETVQTAAGQKDTSAIVGISATALGAAFYRIGSYASSAAEAQVPGVPGREDMRRNVQAITTSVFGVSLLQSLSEHLVVGVTPKIVRGAVSRGVSSALDVHEALDTAKGLEGESSVRVDVDAGAMFYMKKVRVGVVARNLTTPEFDVNGVDGDAFELDREVRAGAAWGSGWTGISRVIVAVDADLTTRVTPLGDRRDIAAGIETWWRNQRLGLRGGVHRSTIGDARAAAAAGVSYGLRPGMLLEAHGTRGQDGAHAWSVGVRMTY